MEQEYKWMVYVSCLTYNHAPYIVDALNGFTMQETTFPYVCAVIDDASTDGEQEVIKNYLHEHFDLEDKSIVRNEETDDYVLTFARHKTNKNCYFAVLYLKYNHYSIKKSKAPYIKEWQDNCKYIAFCEGDDYWICSLKLQHQVDFLEKHSEFSMCFHRARILKECDCKVGLKCNDIEDREYNPNELYKKWKVPTASIVSKREVLEVQNIKSERILNGDIVYVLNSAKIGRIKGMSAVMSVYRVQTSGVTYDERLKGDRTRRYPAHFEFIKDNYPFIDNRLANKKIARAYMNRRKIQTSIVDYLKDVLMAFSYNPLVFMDKFKSDK